MKTVFRMFHLSSTSTRRYRKFVAPLILPWALTGCLFDSSVLWEDEQYHVAWIDTGENRSLYYTLDGGNGIGKIEPEIIAVGSDEFYVVARRKSSPDHGYYYIKKSNQYLGGGDSTHGPYTAVQFEALRAELDLPAFEAYFK